MTDITEFEKSIASLRETDILAKRAFARLETENAELRKENNRLSIRCNNLQRREILLEEANEKLETKLTLYRKCIKEIL